MGLTVQFKLAAPTGSTEAQAKKLVESMRRAALLFQRDGQVDQVLPITADAKTLGQFGLDWMILRVPGKANTSTGVEVCPAAGFLFGVEVGEDCEPLWLGLCRYPETVRFQWQELRTKAGAGWRLSGFSKTQYASLHGWEHFLRCHRAVVELLASLRLLGLRVRITDEGDYWPRRSVAALRAQLDQMNGLVAAPAGALKDLSGKTGAANGIQSPIFGHPEYERLEAESAADSGRLREFVKAVRRAIRPDVK
jgi:hypothetical protein